MSGQSLYQGLSQNQTLAPQMRQSLEILQTNTLELGQLLQQAIEINPTLEDHTDSVSLEELSESESEEFDDVGQEQYEELRELAILENRSLGSSKNDEERREYLMNSIVAPKTLQQHLKEQLDVSFAEEEVRNAAEIIIGNINEKGFIDSELSDLGAKFSISIETLEIARDLLQGFDPAGVAAHNLKECLLIQLEKLKKADSLEYLIVTDYLEELAKKHFPKIAKSLKVDIQEVVEAAEHISALDPAPGSSFDATSNPYIVPDLEIIKNDDGEWEVGLTNEFLPRLRISDSYKGLLATGGKDRKLRTYLKDQIRDGRNLIKALDQRQETILAIGEEIQLKQQEFLKHGISHLKPLTMNVIADKLGIHPTTVSRAVHGKYIRTPHGVVELRRFFATGYRTESGETISNAGVRETIQQIVNEEDGGKPLSDSAIEKLLKEKGLKVARRTIAKYREQLGILPSHLRKKY